ncbi:MAG: universal stress protein [Desulfobacteraceae bacterium]
MSAVSKIMVPIAFSKYSPGLISYAAGLAKDLGADLLVANVINIRSIEAISGVQAMGYRVDAEAYRRNLEEDRRRELRDMLAETDFPAERIRAIFRVGRPFEKLLQIVEEEKPDLLIMGTKAHSELEHVLLGSVAEKMFRHSPVPLLSYRVW